MRVWKWLGRHDPGYAALRRAARTAIVMPTLFAFASVVIRNADVATFAAFGSFSMLLLVGFGGSMRQRIQAQIGLAIAGAALVVLGTLASSPVWLAVVAMALVGFAVLFVGTVSSVLASASTSLLLAFILPVTVPEGLDAIGPRLLGWGIAAVVGVFAIAVMWPGPANDALRPGAARACRAMAVRLRADVDYILSNRDPALAPAWESAIADARQAVSALHTGFLATPYRPTGLSTSARTVVRLIDELVWLDAVAEQSARYIKTASAATNLAHLDACKVKTAAASVLDAGADLLEQTGGDPATLYAAIDRLTQARMLVETNAVRQVPTQVGGVPAEAPRPPAIDGSAPEPPDIVTDFISSLDPSFRAQELGYAVSQLAGNIALTAEAERRSWWDRLLGRQPGNLVGTFSAGLERATAQLNWQSVWLHNSIRGAAALGIAVLLADVTGVQHSFWVVLGTLSVLRSNALSTGQNALRGVLGTSVGVIIGAALLYAIGTNTVVLWILLPIAILAAGVAPAAISFAAGQAGFTITLVLLFNIIAPTGWTVGLYRIEDIALGCAVSLLVGLLFWPRGAAAALRKALAEAYADCMDYLTATVAFGVGRCDATAASGPEPRSEGLRAAAAARRLDDTFRTYLAERGTKRVPLARVTASVTGIAGMRLASDAILDIWQSESRASEGDRSSARRALGSSTEELTEWYRELGRQLVGDQALPAPQPRDLVVDGELVDAVRHDLSDDAGRATPTAVRIIWTGDYLDVVRRLQSVIVRPGALVDADAPASAVGAGAAAGE